MRRYVLALIVVLMGGIAPSLYVAAQEKVTLTTPVFSSLGASDFRIESIYLKRQTALPDGPAVIRAIFHEVDATAAFVANGRTLICTYDGDTAETLIRQLNTMNLSTASLEKRVTQRCQSDGKLGAGSISGTPQ